MVKIRIFQVNKKSCLTCILGRWNWIVSNHILFLNHDNKVNNGYHTTILIRQQKNSINAVELLKFEYFDWTRKLVYTWILGRLRIESNHFFFFNRLHEMYTDIKPIFLLSHYYKSVNASELLKFVFLDRTRNHVFLIPRADWISHVLYFASS